MAPLTRSQAAMSATRDLKVESTGKRSSDANNPSPVPTHHNDGETSCATYQIQLSRSFVFVTLLMSLVVPFSMGAWARTHLLPPQSQQQQQQQQQSPEQPSGRTGSLPSPRWSLQEQPPSTRYSSKHFSTSGTGSESFVARIPSAAITNEEDESRSALLSSSSSSSRQSISYDLFILSPSQFQTEHQVVQFLNDEILSQMPRLEILSFHCHKLSQSRMISCSGIAPRGHIHAHVNTERNVLSLDIMGTDVILKSANTVLGNVKATIVPRGFSSDDADVGNVVHNDEHIPLDSFGEQSAKVATFASHDDSNGTMMKGGSRVIDSKSVTDERCFLQTETVYS